VIGTDFIGSCKSNYHTITVMNTTKIQCNAIQLNFFFLSFGFGALKFLHLFLKYTVQ
jgi:hypothetical protein